MQCSAGDDCNNSDEEDDDDNISDLDLQTSV